MIVGFALRNLFFGEQVYVLGIPKPLAPPPDTRCRGLSRRSPSNQIKETSMIKTEYKKGWSPNQRRSRKEEIPYHGETEYAGLLYAQRQSQKRRSNHE